MMDASAPISALARSKSRSVWAGYFPNHTDAAIRARFESVYGYPPEQVVRQASIVLRVPVGQKPMGVHSTAGRDLEC